MADIHIHRAHTLGLKGARKVAAQWSDKAQTQLDMTCAFAEGDDGDEIRARGQAKCLRRILNDGLARERDARGVSERQIALRGEGLGCGDRHLPGGLGGVVVDGGFRQLVGGFSVMTRASGRLVGIVQVRDESNSHRAIAVISV